MNEHVYSKDSEESQSDQKFEKKNSPTFGNVAKTVANLQKLKLKAENRCIKMCFETAYRKRYFNKKA